MKTKFIIQDWAGNILDFKGKFKLPQLAVPMEFKFFDDAWEYIDLNIDKDSHEDIFVFEKQKTNKYENKIKMR